VHRLARLLNPKSIAIIGGSWAENVITQLLKSGYAGEVWPVHPTRKDVAGVPCYDSLDALPSAPDAAFVGVNRNTTLDVIRSLANRNAGGAICFASGFREAGQEQLQNELIKAAGNMPFLGPNCYGLLNYLDNITLWPDQHGGERVTRGVGVLAQSSNIAINISMQQRGLPIGQIIALGNQAQTDIADLIDAQLNDTRITAIGLYIEGFGDVARFEQAANNAKKLGKPMVAIKVGASEKSQQAVLSHTASLAGNAAVSSAFLQRLGITEVHSTAVFIETLKLFHYLGPLAGERISSVSCSGGEASLMADLGERLQLHYPDFPDKTLHTLEDVLGPEVALANPLDYHTYIWGDVPTMTRCFEAVLNSSNDLSIFVLDIPRIDRCDPASFDCAIEAIITARANTQAATAVLTHLPENMSMDTIQRFHRNGVVVLNGMETGLAAVKAACVYSRLSKQPVSAPVWITTTNTDTALPVQTLLESDAKQALADHGVAIPKHAVCKNASTVMKAAKKLQGPLALKTLGLAHKTGANGLVLNIQDKKSLKQACEQITHSDHGLLLEEMYHGTVAELIIGITTDATGLLALTLGTGGVFTEILQDSVTITLPCTADDVLAALQRLKAFPLLNGYRGQAPVNLNAITQSVQAILSYVNAHQQQLIELEVNPLLVGENTAIAVDALIRLHSSTTP
jgi:acetate---CoA ligase (ADP-forming)